MNPLLLIMLSIIGLLVLYWVIWGQRRYNKMFGGEHIQKIEENIKGLEAKNKKQKSKK